MTATVSDALLPIRNVARPTRRPPRPRRATAFAEGKTHCIWEAPTKETMAEVFAKYEIPYGGIAVVRRFDPVTNTLEPEAAEAKVPQPV